jgi:hypothetical protein
VAHGGSSYLRGRDRMEIQDQPWKTHEILSEEQTKTKRAGGMAPVVEHLPSKSKS